MISRAYRVIREALRASEKVGLGQITLRGREYIASVRPCGDGLLLETLHYGDEIREAEPLFASIGDDDVPDDLLEVATTLIDKKTSSFDVSRFTDNYTVAMHELIERKARSKSTKTVSTDDDEDRLPGTDNVIDLMAALKKSLANSTKGKSSAKKPAKKKAGSTATSKKKKRA